MNVIEAWKNGLGDFVTNWHQRMPLPRKLWLLMRNLALRGIKRQACCGHHGEPGC